MKTHLPIAIVLLALALTGCKKNDTIDCTIYWQLYTQPKYTNAAQIEHAFQESFFGYYEPVNNNTVRALNTTKSDVRSITIKLASMADKRIDDTTDPALESPVEVRVFINFYNSYIEEIWSKTY